MKLNLGIFFDPSPRSWPSTLGPIPCQPSPGHGTVITGLRRLFAFSGIIMLRHEGTIRSKDGSCVVQLSAISSRRSTNSFGIKRHSDVLSEVSKLSRGTPDTLSMEFDIWRGHHNHRLRRIQVSLEVRCTLRLVIFHMAHAGRGVTSTLTIQVVLFMNTLPICQVAYLSKTAASQSFPLRQDLLVVGW